MLKKKSSAHIFLFYSGQIIKKKKKKKKKILCLAYFVNVFIVKTQPGMQCQCYAFLNKPQQGAALLILAGCAPRAAAIQPIQSHHTARGRGL